MDVRIFHGAGIYASDSFRIYSDLLLGKGAPELEARWLNKRSRAIGRMKGKIREKGEGDEKGGTDQVVQGWDIEEIGEYLSDEEEGEEEEWRRVRPKGE